MHNAEDFKHSIQKERTWCAVSSSFTIIIVFQLTQSYPVFRAFSLS